MLREMLERASASVLDVLRFCRCLACVPALSVCFCVRWGRRRAGAISRARRTSDVCTPLIGTLFSASRGLWLEVLIRGRLQVCANKSKGCFSSFIFLFCHLRHWQKGEELIDLLRF